MNGFVVLAFLMPFWLQFASFQVEPANTKTTSLLYNLPHHCTSAHLLQKRPVLLQQQVNRQESQQNGCRTAVQT